jgi:hypothetical protein
MFENIPTKGLMSAAVLILLVGFVAFFLIWKRNTMPLGQVEGFASTFGGAYPRSCSLNKNEGFVNSDGGAYPRSCSLNKNEGFVNSEGFRAPLGSGDLACSQSLSDASALLGMFGGNPNCNPTDEYEELRLILGKLACLKTDLMSTSGLVNSTRYLPYVTSHDREQVAETTARCLAKTIPDRDLDIIFETWQMRAIKLVTKLSTYGDLSEANTKSAESILDACFRDVYDVARTTCLKGEPMMAGKSTSPRDPAPSIPESLADHGPYEGYF